MPRRARWPPCRRHRACGSRGRRGEATGAPRRRGGSPAPAAGDRGRRSAPGCRPPTRWRTSGTRRRRSSSSCSSSTPSTSLASRSSQVRPQITLITFQPAPRKRASNSWMTLPLPRTGPSSRWRLQFTTNTRLSRCSRPAMPRAPMVSGSSNSPSPTKHHTRLSAVSAMPAGVEVAADMGLGDGVERSEAHRDRRVLPELGHQARMRVGGEPVGAHLEAEVVQLLLGEPALDEGPGVDAGGGMALEVDLVAGPAAVLPPEEVVEPHLVEGGRAGVGGQVAADGLRADVGPDHHHRGVPADEGPDPPLEVLVTGEVRLLVGGDGVDVGGRDGGREVHLLLPGPLEDPHQQIARPGPTVDVDDVVERVEPLGRLDRIGVGKLMAHSVEQHLPMLAPHGLCGKRHAVHPSAATGMLSPMSSASPTRRSGDRRVHRRLVPREPGSRGLGVGGGRRPVGQRGGAAAPPTSGWR